MGKGMEKRGYCWRVGYEREREGRGQYGVLKTWSRWWSVMSLFLSALQKQIIMWVCGLCTAFKGGDWWEKWRKKWASSSLTPCQQTGKTTIISYSFVHPLLFWPLCLPPLYFFLLIYGFLFYFNNYHMVKLIHSYH